MLRWNILGTRFISHTIQDAMKTSSGSRIEAAARRDTLRLAAFADRHAITKRYTSTQALVEDHGVDIVYVGFPHNGQHEAVASTARSGKAVLSEKSLTTTMADASTLAAGVRQRGIFLLEWLMYLSHPVIVELGKIISSVRLEATSSVAELYAADIWMLANPKGNGSLHNLGCYPVSRRRYVVQTAFGPKAFTDPALSGCGNLGSVRFITNPWLPVANDNILEVEDYGKAPERIALRSDCDALAIRSAPLNDAFARGSRRRRPGRLRDSIEIMEPLNEWEALRKAAH
jgi:hypothetical protein